MEFYPTLVEALEDLKRKGYTIDFDLKSDCIVCPPMSIRLNPEEFSIVEVHRFDNDTDPAYSDVLYVIEGTNGLKGTLTDAYGAYSDALNAAMTEKLGIHRL